MAIAPLETPSPVHLLAEAVQLARAASRLGGLAGVPLDRATAASLRTLLDELGGAAREVELRYLRTPLRPAVPAPSPGPCGGAARTDRAGHLQVDAAAGGEVRLRGRGPAGEGDLVRAALRARARDPLPVTGSATPDTHAVLGARLWDALVLLAHDGLDPPTALPTPLSLVGRVSTTPR